MTSPNGEENAEALPAPVMMAEPEPAPPPPFPRPLGARRATFILVMYFLAQVVAVVLVMIILQLTLAPGDDKPALMDLEGEGIIPGTIAALLLGGLVVRRLARRSFPEDSGNAWLTSLGWIRTSWRDLAAGAGIGVVSALTYLIVAGSLFEPSENQEPGRLVNAALSSSWARAGWAAAAIFLAPPVEEFLFRGVLLRGFTQSWGVLIASIITSVIFTALHYGESSGYLPGLVAIGFMAILTTIARLSTGSLKPAIAIHAGYNLVMVALLFLAPE